MHTLKEYPEQLPEHLRQRLEEFAQETIAAILEMMRRHNKDALTRYQRATLHPSPRFTKNK